MRLLIVEDEPEIAAHVARLATGLGFVCDVAAKIGDARAYAQVSPYDAVVLDLALPDGDGLTFLTSLRAGGMRAPVLAVTARDGVEARIAGLDAGADDYLEKPFDGREFLARMRALLRRPANALGKVLRLGNIGFDTVSRSATVAGRPLELSRFELAMLEILLRRVGQVALRSILFDGLYNLDNAPETDAVSVHMHHLRRKLLAAKADAKIVTFRGLGYMLRQWDA